MDIARPVNETNPGYYRQYGIETIEVVELMTFNGGNAVKYLTRAPFKENEKRDLSKSLWYFDQMVSKPFAPIRTDEQRERLVSLGGILTRNMPEKEGSVVAMMLALDLGDENIHGEIAEARELLSDLVEQA